MRAVVMKLKFEDNVPEPQISGTTVLIAAATASVNPIDWKLRSGMRQKDSPLSFPAILGRDVSGIVRAVGAKCEALQGGDRVFAPLKLRSSAVGGQRFARGAHERTCLI